MRLPIASILGNMLETDRKQKYWNDQRDFGAFYVSQSLGINVPS